ncbi:MULTISPECIES: hypothetical protein [Pseudomonas]|uniref:hypothetical protein n=1 Tax=Pseudomonas TaxID=286 RepID=UPI000CD5938B|nr:MULTISPECIES: hypothetical protein [Pseudomonas]RBH58401.1 hypothetical protein C3F00_006680 [Pseudomonas sp. MWU13-2860]
MEHNPTSERSNIPNDLGLFADAGIFYIRALRELAQDNDAKGSIRKDWATIREWLGCHDNELTTKYEEKVGKAWRAYLALGLAPSQILQSVFDLTHALYKNSDLKHDRPPVEVMNVFDRMLATDDQISLKRVNDLATERQKLAQIIQNLPRKSKQGWWRRQSRSFRGWAFVSIAWAAIALFIIIVFDPLERGNWHWATGRDYIKAMTFIFLPVLAGLLKTAYSRAVQ